LSFTEEEAARLEGHPGTSLELIDSFERDFLVPGLDPGRLAMVWVQHRDHGRTELHFIITNVDLETQKDRNEHIDERAGRPSHGILVLLRGGTDSENLTHHSSDRWLCNSALYDP
jgi:hypothetical protein